jgi:hypothetical protein
LISGFEELSSLRSAAVDVPASLFESAMANGAVSEKKAGCQENSN